MDKRIPLALLLALGVQTATVVWWASNASATLATYGSELSQHESRLGAIENSQSVQAVNNAVLTQQLVSLREDLQEVKNSQAETNRLLRDLSTDRSSRP